MEFKVLRKHTGDRPYSKGDFREANKADVQHLIDAGVLAAKAEPKVQNKAEKAAPKNKSED